MENDVETQALKELSAALRTELGRKARSRAQVEASENSERHGQDNEDSDEEAIIGMMEPRTHKSLTVPDEMHDSERFRKATSLLVDAASTVETTIAIMADAGKIARQLPTLSTPRHFLADSEMSVLADMLTRSMHEVLQNTYLRKVWPSLSHTNLVNEDPGKALERILDMRDNTTRARAEELINRMVNLRQSVSMPSGTRWLSDEVVLRQTVAIQFAHSFGHSKEEKSLDEFSKKLAL